MLWQRFHLKQNLFEVALLTSGNVTRWYPEDKPYLDPRTATIPLNTYFAEGMQLNGLSIYAGEILANMSLIDLVKSHNQSIYIWGPPLNNSKDIDYLIEKGVDGLIIDKNDKFVTQTNPENQDDSKLLEYPEYMLYPEYYYGPVRFPGNRFPSNRFPSNRFPGKHFRGINFRRKSFSL